MLVNHIKCCKEIEIKNKEKNFATGIGKKSKYKSEDNKSVIVEMSPNTKY
jgi:hypothetical protein